MGMKNWLDQTTDRGMEEHHEPEVIVQDNKTPQKDFSTNEKLNTENDTAKPATVQLDAASDDDDDTKVVDQGHQKVTLPEGGSVSQTDTTGDTEEKISNEQAASDVAGGDLEEPNPDGELEQKQTSTIEHEGGADTAPLEQDQGVEVDANPTPKEGDDQTGAKVDQEVKPEVDSLDTISNESATSSRLDWLQRISNEEFAGNATTTDPKTGMVNPSDIGDSPGEGMPDGKVTDKMPEGDDDGHRPKPTTVDKAVEKVELDPEDDAADQVITDELSVEDYSLVLSQERFERIEEDIDTMLDKVASVEKYNAMFQEALDNGGVTRDVAEAIRLGLEAVDPSFGFDHVVASTESFGGTMSRYQATQISMEAAGNTAARIVEAIKRALKALFDTLAELWQKLRASNAKTKERAAQINRRLQAMKSNEISETVTIGGSNRLTVNDVFVGNDPRALKDMSNAADYLYQVYPKSIGGVINDVVQEFGNPALRDPKTAEGAVLDAIKAMGNAPGKHFKMAPGARPLKQGELSKAPAVETAVGTLLPGNKAIIQWRVQPGLPKWMDDLISNRDVKDVVNMGIVLRRWTESIKVDFDTINAKQSQNEETYKVPNKQQLTQVMRGVDEVLKSTDKASEADAKYKEARKRLEAVSDKMHEMYDEMSFKGSDFFAQCCMQMTRILAHPTTQFSPYVLSTCNAYLSVVERNIEAHEQSQRQAAGETIAGALPAA